MNVFKQIKNNIKNTNNVDIFAFLEGEQENLFGLHIEEFFAFDYKTLETKHNYIQWVFPTPEPSKHGFSPKITLNDAKTRNNETIRQNMRKAYQIMRSFYSIERKSEWLTPGNHNFLRISRILRSLRVFSLDEEAEEFYNYLCKVKRCHPNAIPDKTVKIWTERNKKVW